MEKPDYLRLVTDEFKTPAQRAAARDILLLWPTIKNFAEMSRRSKWSEPHLRSVYKEYFEAAESEGKASSPAEADIVDAESDVGIDDTEAYKAGYRDGYRDGVEDSTG